MKKILLVTAAAAGIIMSGATVASAGVTPSPTPSHPIYTPPPRPAQLPEQFELSLNTNGDQVFNVVNARGPVRFRDGRDTTVNDLLDVFDDRGPNAVNVRHLRLPTPLINPATCSATFLQQGPWAFNGGRGLYRFARGSGQYTLVGLVSARERQLRSWDQGQDWNWNWRHHNVVCPLQGLTAFQILRLVLSQNPNPRGIQFDQVSFDVQATGFASVPSHPIYPGPNPCPTINHFAPTATPSLTAFRGGYPTPEPTSTCDAVPAPTQIAA